MEISEVFKIAEKQLNQTNTELEFKKVNEDEKSITFAGEKGAYRIAYDMQASTMAFECCYDYEADEPKFETISRSLYDAETYNEKDAKSLGNEINDEISGIFKARKQVNLDKVKMPKAVSRTKAKNGIISYDCDSLANRFGTLYPEYKDEIKKKVEEAAKILDLEKLLDRKPKALSGGQRQRVAMGRAIVRNPKVFLMDEPLSNLDAKLRVQMRSEIASLHNRLKATIIYVTHDQTEAMTLGTRIVVLKDGVIMQVDSPQKLYNEPNNLFVAGFIGSPQMNFIDAVCKVEGERVTLNFEKTSVVLPPAKAKKLIDGGYNGKTVVMGIRPEDIGDSQIEIEAHKDAVFETDVTGYELLGSEVLLYFNVAGTAMTAKVDSRTTARMGDHITLAIDPEKIHCFDKETELTITN